MIELFHQVSQACSKLTTERYSTSFASAIRLLHKDLRMPICNIYGFVRLADEIVDSFHTQDKATLLDEFKKDTYLAIERGISLNPILHSFQLTVNQFKIDKALIDSFLLSMEKDLHQHQYDLPEYQAYIYGSAEVVGLMCLTIFCNGNQEQYEKLKPFAQSLGAAFQKVNFLRDVKADFQDLNRMYFPQCNFHQFSENEKAAIEADIQNDFALAYQGILQLPIKARFGVYVAYKYYLSLFKKIKRMHPQSILEERVRIANFWKWIILAKAGLRNQFNLM